MSRVGLNAIEVTDGVKVDVSGREVSVSGPKGNLTVTLPEGISAELEDGRIAVRRREETREARSLHGLGRSLVANMVKGVSEGFSKSLEIQGVGFRGALQGKKLTLSLGYSHPVEFDVPDDISVDVEGGTIINVSGPDKQRVGDFAARLRRSFPAEPYKGKGVRYRDEYVRRKVGKTVA